LMYVLCC